MSYVKHAEQKPAETHQKNGLTHASSYFRQYLPRNLCFGWTCHLSNFNLQISAEIYSCDFPRRQSERAALKHALKAALLRPPSIIMCAPRSKGARVAWPAYAPVEVLRRPSASIASK